MTHFASWISPDVLRALGWSLVHFLWQGAAIAALLAAGMALCRTATTRYALAVAALVLMLAAPVITFAVLSHNSGTASSLAPAVSLSSVPNIFSHPFAAASGSPATIDSTSPLRADALLWFVEIWFAGVIVLSLRTVGGVMLIERMRRRDAKPIEARVRELCLAVQQRLGIARAIRYCESTLLDAPAVIGWFRPAILLPITALTGLSDEQFQAVIAHELAHIRRFDNFVNLFQIVVETLLFYHPTVWWVSKRIRAERENCCDDAAISVCNDAVAYARALAQMAESRTAPALAMAANRGPLADRVARLIGARRTRSEIRSVGIVASLVCLAGAVIAANGFLGLAHTAFASVVPEHTRNFSEPVEAAGEKEPDTAVASSNRAPTNAITDARIHSAVEARVHSMVHSAIAETTNEVTRAAYVQQEQTQDSDNQKPKESYIDGMKAAGFDNLSADELIALKIQGVTPDYVRQMHELGFKPSIDELISMRVQGITPEYVRNMRAAGFNVDVDKLIGMKVQGITPDYVRGMHDVGVDANDVDELIGLRVQGVTPDYIKEMRAAGVDVKNVDTLIGLRVQGVSPEYVAGMKQLGIDPKSDELIGLKVQGVTPEYIKEMRAVGLDVTADRAIGMKVQGITPEYVKGMHDLGFKSDVDELIGMRVQGVSPEYVRDIRATGLNPTAHQIIALRVQGVNAEYIKGLQGAGFKDVSVQNVIRARVNGVTPEFIQDARKHGFGNLDLDKMIQLKNAGVF